MVVDCPVISFSPTEIYAGNGAGQVYPTVSVSTLNDCRGYTVTENYSWLSYSKSGLNVTITVQANTGPARTGYVWIGSGDSPLVVNQACGGYPGAAGSISGSSSVCQGQMGISYSVGAISGATGYSWTLPSGATISSGSNTNSITVDFSTSAVSGDITVRGTNSCGPGTASSLYVSVNSLPTATSGSNSPVCAGQTINLSSSGGSSYSWSGPNNYASSSQYPSIPNASTANTGTYTVIVTNSSGCSAISNTYVTVNSLPTPSASSNSPVCNGAAIGLLSSGGSGYSWSGPNGYSSTLQNPTIPNSTTSMSGTYYVTVTDNNNCSSQASVSVTVYPALTASISGGTSPICYNTSPGTFTATASGGIGSYSYLWYKNGVSTGVTTQNYSPGLLPSSSTFYCDITSGSGVQWLHLLHL
ncbi:MAG: hypothetical protein IPH69_05450 [Bacteroidales bacterium]|nr:hypothetical protein [Bacteroidales bacterium]